MLIEIVSWLLLFGLSGGIAIHVFGLFGLYRFIKQPLPDPKPELNSLSGELQLPGVTVIKPCITAADGEIDNFDTFFNQDYQGAIQLLFVVADLGDPIVPVIQLYLTRYPNHDAQLVIATTRKAYHKKVDSLYDGLQLAKYDMIIWSDSDTIVRKDYVRQTVGCLQEPGVSVVSVPQYDIKANTLAAVMKMLGNNADLTAYVLSYYAMIPKNEAAFGHSIAFFHTELNALPVDCWDSLNNSSPDDQVFPKLYTQFGKKVVLKNIYCPVQYSNKTFKQLLEQQIRFAIHQKQFTGTFAFLIGFLFMPQLPATLYILINPFEAQRWGIWLGVALFRIVYSAITEHSVLESTAMTRKFFWTIIAWDYLRVYIQWRALFTKGLVLNGKHFRFVGRYRLEEMPQVSVQKNGR